ncbi:MAG: hypothetical protein EAY75_16670 [Bacteroidetes bacterium]|nr:MAG: hypothetical protein EAY75_16670 [Bacteroidota bacterium]
MAILKFRIYLQEDESIYRDVVIKHNQTFFELHECILKAYEFDSKHAATYYRSNDHWEEGREISLEVYSKAYKAPPLLMKNTVISTEIKDTNQKFIYVYDFVKNWIFLVELISVSKEESSKIVYPSISRKEGIGPQQYGTRGLLGPKFAEIEEKYDLNEAAEGFGEEGEDGEASEQEETFTEDSNEEI